MSFTTAAAAGSPSITRYQWLTLVSAFLGWAFDSMDLNLFTLVMVPSVAELTGTRDPGAIAHMGGLILAIKLLCWGIGGIFFGVIADRFGRARTMIITIIIYATFTGLSGLAQSWTQLAVLQGIAGFGIGGEWAAGAALLAETWPEKHRARAMQVMQMAFAVGFFFAALANLMLGPISWRWVLAAGALPAVVSLIIRHYVPEPERWRQARAREEARGDAGAMATFKAIFAPDLRRKTIVGVLVSSAMMIGCWGGLALLPNWINQLVRASGGANGVQAVSYAFMLMMVGALAGYVSLIWFTEWLGRRGAYFLFCLGALASSLYLFMAITDLNTLLWFMLVYGFFVIGGFGTFALYLPELFPTRVRATGQGFAWNAARCITAAGPLLVGTMLATFGSFPAAAAATTAAYLVGLVAIWFGPETKGQPLED
ncbi:MFS transporter [Xanthobacter tagetidis]|uniref:MFS transporter n=1 Tax=Xanthobacter tagetidis TaxID=60216 RepID=A0A3L7ADQ7_9HYPH|nr:MFS transporter [Xanthobacter tagetidis]MBB6305843.1 MFS family permease [Xanthobacter tagetidis]RLP78367.1 MFS transporter [Xanthobacter tagetidis]